MNNMEEQDGEEGNKEEEEDEGDEGDGETERRGKGQQVSGENLSGYEGKKCREE